MNIKSFILSMAAIATFTTACTAQETVKALQPGEFSRSIAADRSVVILDVRTPAEFAEGHLAGAVNLDVLQEEAFAQDMARLDKSKTYHVYCRSGRRSHDAAVKMAAEGLKVVDLAGGYLAWTAANLPVTSASAPALVSGLTYETFKTTGGKELRIGLIKHGSLSLSFDGYEIQIDPVASYGKPTDYAAMPKADLILITHEHGDHLDPATIDLLTKDGTKLYLNERSFKATGKGEVLRNGDERTVSQDITLKAVPAYNTTPDRLQYHPKGVGNGYVLQIDGLRVYVAGDTEDIAEMSQLKNIDVAFLPVNQPYTMTVEQAVRAAKAISPAVLIPYHFGQTDVRQIKDQLQGSGIDVRLRDMQ